MKSHLGHHFNFCIREAQLECWLLADNNAEVRPQGCGRAQENLPQAENSQSSCLSLLSYRDVPQGPVCFLSNRSGSGLGNIYVIFFRFDWRSEVWAGGSGTDRVPSLCSSSLPSARDTFLLEIFSLMAFAISIILRKKQNKWRGALCAPFGSGSRKEHHEVGSLPPPSLHPLGPWRIPLQSQQCKAHRVIQNRELREAQA